MALIIWGGPQALHTAVFIGLNTGGSLQGAYLHAFRHGALDLGGQGGHVRHTTAVNNAYLLGTQAYGGTHRVHGHVAAAHYSHFLAVQIHGLALTHGAQKFHGRNHAGSILVLHAQLLIGTGADAHQHGVVGFAQLFNGDVPADALAQLHLHAGFQNGLDVIIQPFLGQAVVGNTITQHAAQLR